MKRRVVFFVFAAGMVACISFGTKIWTELSDIVQNTFSPDGLIVMQIPLASTTNTAVLPAAVTVEFKPSAYLKKTPVLSSVPSTPTSTITKVISERPAVLVLPNGAHPTISEIMVGSKDNTKNEFIELYNPNSVPLDLTGYSIRKKSSSGTESSLVSSSRLEGKAIGPSGYFLIANGGGYDGPIVADVLWPASYSLAAKNNAVVLYNESGEKVEELSWVEIPADASLVRSGWSGNRFDVSPNPDPQNSQSI